MHGSHGVRVLLLGPVAIDAGQGAAPVTSRQQALVLALLAMQPGRALTTDQLIEHAWSDRPPPTARAALRVHLARLRAALQHPGVLPHSARGYALDPHLVRTDVQDLTDLHHALDAAGSPAERLRIATEALSLWRGEMSAHEDPVLTIHVERLTEVRLSLEDARTEALLDLGQHVQVCADLLALVSAEPMREQRTRQLMLALYRSGRQAEALSAYRRLRRTLVSQLGVEPSHDTVRLEVAILRQEPHLTQSHPPAAAVPADIPAPGVPHVDTPLPGTPLLAAPLRPHQLPQPTAELTTLVQGRLLGSSDPTAHLAKAVAWLGGNATTDSVTDVLGWSDAELDVHAAEASAAGLVALEPEPGRLAQRPEVTAVLLTSEPPRAAASWSARAGAALVRLGEDLPARVRGAWLVLRGDDDRAIPSVLPVIDDCIASHHADAAADLCAAALVDATDLALRADLLTRHSRALALTGHDKDGATTWSEAVAAARASGDPVRLALAILSRSWAFRSVGSPPATALVTEALDALGPDPSALRLRLLCVLVQEIVLSPDGFATARSLATQIDHLAARLGDPDAQAASLGIQHILLRGGPDLTARQALTTRLTTTAASCVEADAWLSRAVTAQLSDLFIAGDLAAVPALADQLRALHTGLRSRRVLWHHALTMTSLLRDRGEFEQASDWCDQGALLGAAAGMPDAANAAALHHLQVLFLTASTAPFVPIIRSFLEGAPDTMFVRALLALALVDAGDPATALDVATGVPVFRPDGAADESVPLSLGILADAAWRIGASELAAALAEALAPFAGQWLVFGQVTGTWGPADRARGLALAASGQLDTGVRLVEAARAAALASGAQAWVARCDADLVMLGGAAPSSEPPPG